MDSRLFLAGCSLYMQRVTSIFKFDGSEEHPLYIFYKKCKGGFVGLHVKLSIDS